MNDDGERDPIDRLYERLDPVEPPADFVPRVLARARQGEVARWPRWQRLLFSAGYVAALLVLAVLAFLTGVELERSGLRDLLSLAVHDLSAVTEAPGVYFAALRDAVPWLHVFAIVADLALLAVATRMVLKVSKPASAAAALRAPAETDAGPRQNTVEMMTLWTWAGKHATAVKLGSLFAALLLLLGGLVLGVNQASGNPAPAIEVGETPPANLAKQTSHYIVGTIALVLPARREAIVRQRNGQLVQVSFDAATVVRRDRARQAQTAVRRGTRVIILGEPEDGRMHAKVVTITGQAPARVVTPTRPPVPAPGATPGTKPSPTPG